IAPCARISCAQRRGRRGRDAHEHAGELPAYGDGCRRLVPAAQDGRGVRDAVRAPRRVGGAALRCGGREQGTLRFRRPPRPELCCGRRGEGRASDHVSRVFERRLRRRRDGVSEIGYRAQGPGGGRVLFRERCGRRRAGPRDAARGPPAAARREVGRVAVHPQPQSVALNVPCRRFSRVIFQTVRAAHDDESGLINNDRGEDEMQEATRIEHGASAVGRTRLTPFGGALCAALAAWPLGAVAQSGAWEHPVTPWGDPDLQGRWPIRHMTLTPLERPVELGTRAWLNDEEFAQRVASIEARNTRYDRETSENRLGQGHWAE